MSLAEMEVQTEAPPVPIPEEPPTLPLNVDLHALAKEVLAATEQATAAQAALDAEKAAVRTWYRDFIKDSWEYADHAGHCPTWERCCAEAGVPGRTKERAVSVSGHSSVPMTARGLAQLTRLSVTTAEAMLEALPSQERFFPHADTWTLTVSAMSMFPDDWDPLDTKAMRGCICEAARERYREMARRQYGDDVVVSDLEVRSGCPASHHTQEASHE